MTTPKKDARRVRLGFAVAAAVFLFNPNVMLLDVLPDAVGYLLLLMAFSPLADAVPHFDDAVTGFRRLAFLTLLRYPAFVLMTWVYFNETSERPIVPLLCLVFGALELIFGIPAFRSLFTGMEYAASLSDCDDLLYLPRKAEKGKNAKGKQKAKKPLSRLFSLTVVMLIIKAAAELAPELTLLTSFDSLGYVTTLSLDILHYRPYFMVLAGIVSLISGTIWLCRFLPYFRAAAKSNAFIAYLSARVAEQRRFNPENRRCRIFWRAAILLISGFALQIDLFSDERNILPDFIGILLLLLGSAELAKLAPRRRAVTVSGWIAAGISFLAAVGNTLFLRTYDYEAVGRVAAVGQHFILLFASALTEQIALLVFLFFLSRQLSSVAKVCARYPGDELNDLSAKKIPVWRLLSRRFSLSLVFASAASVTTVLLLLSRTDTVRLRTRLNDTVFYVPRIGWMWILHFAVTLLWVLYSASTVLTLRRETEYAADRQKDAS